MSALVLLHGFTGHAASFQKLLAQLPLTTRVLCPVLLGHDGHGGGDEDQSPASKAEASCGFTAEVDRIAAQIRGAHLGPAHLVGYSLGARVALGLLVRHRELFHSATLLSVNPGLQSAEERQARVAADERWIALLQEHGLAAFLTQWEQQPLFATQRNLPAAVRAAQDAVRRRHSEKGLARALRELGLGRMPDYWPALPELGLPVRLVVGALDAKFAALADRAATLLPAAAVVRVPGVGHNLLLEAPEALSALLAAPAFPTPTT